MRPHAPRDEGSVATSWTVARRGVALRPKLAVRLRGSARRTALHQLGRRWGRPRLARPPTGDPEHAHQQGGMATAVMAAGPDAALLDAAEARLQRLPWRRAMGPWGGEPRRVPTPGTKVPRARFGARNIRPGRWGYLVRERRRHEDVLAVRVPRLVASPQGPSVLIVAHVSRPTAHAVPAWGCAHPRLPWGSLPTDGSQVTPVERIWLRLKKMLAPTRGYGSRRLGVETVEAFLTAMTPEQALAWAAACKV